MESKRFSLVCFSLDGAGSSWQFKFDSLFLSEKSTILLITGEISNKQSFFPHAVKVRDKMGL